MKAILGKKIIMTRLFDEAGNEVPVTLIKLEDNVIVQIKTIQKDGYNAIQIGAGNKKKLNKCEAGRYKKTDLEIRPKILYEIQTDEEYKVGQKLALNQFEEGEKVNITGISKGKGFAGTVKRYHFHLGPKTHGSNNYRRPGSIGATYPERVIKGHKMAGHLGHQRTTIKNLDIVKIDNNNQEIILKGSIPGSKSAPVLIWSHNEA